MTSKKTYSVEYRKDEKYKILVRIFTGLIDMQGVIAAWEEDIKNKMVTQDLNAIVTDFTNADNRAKMSDIDKITAFYKKHFKLFEHIKMGVVVDNPSVAILLFYESQNPEMQHKAFATMKAAMNWSKLESS